MLSCSTQGAKCPSASISTFHQCPRVVPCPWQMRMPLIILVLTLAVALPLYFGRQYHERYRSLPLLLLQFSVVWAIAAGISKYSSKMFGVHSLLGTRHSYSPLTNGDNTEKYIQSSPNSSRARVLKWLVVLLALFGVGGLGFFAGRRSSPSFEEQEDFHCQFILIQCGLSLTPPKCAPYPRF
jgi:hypothetical protein